LIVGLIFKSINDEWDKDLSKAVVLGGMICMNIGVFFLFFISEKHYVNEEEVKEKKEVKKSNVKADIGDGMFNSVLVGTLCHKILSSLTLMGVRY